MIDTEQSEAIRTGRTLVDRRGDGAGPVLGRRARDGLFARWFYGKRRGRGTRLDRRESCCIVSVMVLIDRNLAIDGLMTGIGPRTILFRPASTYIFDRRGAEVSMRFADSDVRGRVSDVGPNGYTVTLLQLLTDETVEEIITLFGLTGGAGLSEVQPSSLS